MALTIETNELDALTKKVAQMNRRAAKLELEPVTFETTERTVRRPILTHDGEFTGRYREVVVLDVTFDGQAPKVNGYTLVCRVEHTEAGNIVTGPQGADVDLSPWYDAQPTCDHCHTVRARRDTFVLANEAGESLRVGRSCLADFVRSTEAERVFEASLWGNFFGSTSEDSDEMGMMGYCRSAVSVRQYVATAVVVTRAQNGYRKEDTRSAISAALGRPPTGEAYADWLEMQPKEPDFEQAGTMIQWAAEQTGNDYSHNLSVAVQLMTAGPRTMGLLASLPHAYAKAMGLLTARAADLPEIDVPTEYQGKRVTLTGSVLSYKWQDDSFGGGKLKALVRVETNGGRWKVWMTASFAETEYDHRQAGDIVTFTAKVERKDRGFAIASRPTKVSVQWAKGDKQAPPEAEETPDPFGDFGEESAHPKAA